MLPTKLSNRSVVTTSIWWVGPLGRRPRTSDEKWVANRIYDLKTYWPAAFGANAYGENKKEKQKKKCFFFSLPCVIYFLFSFSCLLAFFIEY